MGSELCSPKLGRLNIVSCCTTLSGKLIRYLSFEMIMQATQMICVSATDNELLFQHIVQHEKFSETSTYTLWYQNIYLVGMKLSSRFENQVRILKSRNVRYDKSSCQTAQQSSLEPSTECLQTRIIRTEQWTLTIQSRIQSLFPTGNA